MIAFSALTMAAIGCAQPSDVVSLDAQLERRDAQLDVFALPPIVPSVPGYCSAPAHCEDGDVCTIDVCRVASPVRFQGTCTHERIEGCITPPDAGRPDAGNDAAFVVGDAGSGPDNPIDSSCLGGGAITPVLLSYVPLGPLGLEPGCAQGLELQNCVGSVSLRRLEVGDATARTLVVDIATYTAPDRLRIHGIDAMGTSYVLLDTCRMRTSEVGDPTDGRSRPPDEVIRRFEIELRAGTQSLTLDATGTSTPWYMRVLGLCDLGISSIDPACDLGLRDAVP